MTSAVVRFGPFELNPRTGELRKHGRRLPLSPQPARLLSLLASRAGALVTREEIRKHLWDDEVFVDYEVGLNACLADLRAILGDRARAPRYIETLPRRGYRFIAPVERPRPFAQPTIAVLPFANLGVDPSLEYFADGMTDALITELAGLSGLRVISRQTVLHLKGSDKPLSTIARELGVDAVVEGTVVHGASAIRISAQLVAVSPERHLWAHAYECAPSDVLSVHRQVARAVAERIEAVLTTAEVARLSQPALVHPEAHDAYLKGVFHAGDWSSEGLGKALRYFERAIAIDPAYAAPHAALGKLYGDLAYWGHLPLDEGYGRAKQEALAALELDEGLAPAHTALAWVNWFHEWDLEGADRERRRALELAPSDVQTLLMSGMFRQAAWGEEESGVEQVGLACALDPLSQAMNAVLAWVFMFGGDLGRARDQARATLDLFPNSVQACYVLGISQLALGEHEEAITVLEKAAAIARDPLTLGYLGWAYGIAGRPDAARRLLAELTARREGSFVALKPFLVIHVGLRDDDRALHYLEEAYRVRDPILFHVLRVPLFTPLHAQPRFRAVIDRVPVLSSARRRSAFPRS